MSPLQEVLKARDSVGGICGQACSDAKIVNCNNKADITAQGGQAGGFGWICKQCTDRIRYLDQ